MLKIFASFLFSFMLLGFTVAPTIITVLDYECELSIFIDGEEEEKEGKEGKESSKDIEVKLSENQLFSTCSMDNLFEISTDYYSDLYASKFKELVSPPPEHTA